MSGSPLPPPFSSLYFPTSVTGNNLPKEESFETQLDDPPAFSSAPPFEDSSSCSGIEADTKAVLPREPKDGPGARDVDDGEPPPPYTEGSSPLDSFTYVMAAAGGAASIITQVSQGGGGGPLNGLGGTLTAFILNVQVTDIMCIKVSERTRT